MFTGLIQSGAFIKSIKDFDGFRQILVAFPKASWRAMKAEIGSSIAVNGVCLTVVTFQDETDAVLATFDASPETLRLSNLREVRSGDPVHFEASLRVGQELGGHWVLGHVDGTGELESLQPSGPGLEMRIVMRGDFSRDAAPLVVPKGSITIDGVSLTINGIHEEEGRLALSFFLVPHTVRETRFQKLAPGALVNVELDLVGKYILRKQQWEAQAL